MFGHIWHFLSRKPVFPYKVVNHACAHFIYIRPSLTLTFADAAPLKEQKTATGMLTVHMISLEQDKNTVRGP